MRVEVKKGEGVLGRVESRNIEGRKGRWVRERGFYSLLEGAGVDAITLFPWAGKESEYACGK